MQECGLTLMVHGEATGKDVDVFDRERVFIERTLAPLVERFAGLRASSRARDDGGRGRVRPRCARRRGRDDYRSSPAAQSQRALRRRAASPPLLPAGAEARAAPGRCCWRRRRAARRAFFLGTDSAPHPRHAKESTCGCAGLYTAHAGIELYAEAFDGADALGALEAFASLNGPAFYGLEPNRETITLRRDSWSVPDELPVGGDVLVPFRAGDRVTWRIVQ